MSQTNSSTPFHGGSADQARSDRDTLTGDTRPAHHENEEARHQGNDSSSSHTVGEAMRHQGHRETGSDTMRGASATQESPSAPEALARSSSPDQQTLPHQAVATMQPPPPRPLDQTVPEDLSCAADSLRIGIELPNVAAEPLGAAVSSPTTSDESSTEQQSEEASQEQTQQSSTPTFADASTSPPQTSTGHDTPTVRPNPLLPPGRLDLASERFHRTALDGPHGPEIQPLAQSVLITEIFDFRTEDQILRDRERYLRIRLQALLDRDWSR